MTRASCTCLLLSHVNPVQLLTNRINEAGWCTMEPLILTEHMKVRESQSRGVRSSDAMVRPKTTPMNFRVASKSHSKWDAQARLLPQPALSRQRSLEDSSTVRRLAANQKRTAPPRHLSPAFDSRSAIFQQQAANVLSRTQRDGAATVDSWRSDRSRAPRAPPSGFADSRRQRSPSRQCHPDYSVSSSAGLTSGLPPARSPIRPSTKARSGGRGRRF